MANENQIINGFDFGQLQITKTFCGKIIEGKDGWDHFLWNIQIMGKNDKVFTTQYKCGLGHMEKIKAFRPMPNPPYRRGTIAYNEWYNFNHKPKVPSNSNVMYSLLLDSETSDYSFSEWCDNFGYSNDSIQALDIYRDCGRIAKELHNLFSQEEIQQMRAALQDY